MCTFVSHSVHLLDPKRKCLGLPRVAATIFQGACHLFDLDSFADL
jgi:hypothetical protein